MPRSRIAVFTVAALVSASAFAEPDYDDCKDVFVKRLAGFHIQACTEKKLASYIFAEGSPKATTVEGRILDTFYRTDEGQAEPSPLAVRLNYESLFKQAGWTIVYADNDSLTATQVKDGEERWLQLTSNVGDFYELVGATKGSSVHTVTTAEDLFRALTQSGRVALHINFDMGRDTIRPDSQDALAQVVVLLQKNPTLNLGVEAFTDNAGGPKFDQRLSEARAQAVMAALVAKGISVSRLTATGFAQERPVADNATDEGRGKNSRVELVKR